MHILEGSGKAWAVCDYLYGSEAMQSGYYLKCIRFNRRPAALQDDDGEYSGRRSEFIATIRARSTGFPERCSTHIATTP